MNSIIKEQYEHFKKTSPPRPVYASAPFSIIDQMWMYHYLFPEVLQVYDEWVVEKYEEHLRLHTLLGYKKFHFTAPNGEAAIFPCWVLPEGEVLRIMRECKIL